MNDPLDPRWSDALREHRSATEATPTAWAAIVDRAAEPPSADRPVSSPPSRFRSRLLVAAAAIAVLALGAAGAFALGSDRADDVAASPTASTEPDPSAPSSEPVPSTAGPTQLYETSGTVLENADHGPELCSAVATSYPPQCGGIPIEGWDWSATEGSETANGVTWGEYRIIGRYDGEVFTLTDIPDPIGPYSDIPDPGDDGVRFRSPCPEPAGGWVTTDESKAGRVDLSALQSAAEADPQYSGLWVDNSVPGPAGIGLVVVAFTGDLDRHATELAELWGGPICITEADHTEAELQAAIDTVRSSTGADGRVEVAGHTLRLTSTSIDQVAGVVEFGIVWAPDGAEQDIAEALGVPVRLMAQIRPVE